MLIESLPMVKVLGVSTLNVVAGDGLITIIDLVQIRSLEGASYPEATGGASAAVPG